MGMHVDFHSTETAEFETNIYGKGKGPTMETAVLRVNAERGSEAVSFFVHDVKFLDNLILHAESLRREMLGDSEATVTLPAVKTLADAHAHRYCILNDATGDIVATGFKTVSEANTQLTKYIGRDTMSVVLVEENA